MIIEKFEHKLTATYISEDSILTEKIESYLSEHKTILLIAPQGTGKTTYIQSLDDKDFINQVIGLFPTRMLQDQQKQDGKKGGFSHATTYFSGEYFLELMEKEGLSNKNNLIFIDEIHKIIQYSAFAYESQTVPALSVIEKAKENPCILATATPDYLNHCCTDESFYQSIDVIIEVTRQKDYIKHLTLLDGNAKRDTDIKSLILKNQKPNTKQIILLNNKDKCDAWAEEFKQSGIHGVAIHSKTDRQNTDIGPIYTSITTNGKLNCEILLATSWIDIGISFKDENITNLYCLLNNNWSDGDFTMVKQFMARARKSTPHLYITRPQLSYQERQYLKDMILRSEYKGNFYPGTDFYKELERDIIHTAQIQSDLINRHKVYSNAADSAVGCLKLGGNYIANPLHCKYYLYTLYEKQQIEKFKDDDTTKEILSHHFNIDVGQIDIQTYATERSPEEEQAIIDYLEELNDSKEKFKQADFCTKIKTITRGNINYQKAGQLLNHTFIDGKPLKSLFNLNRKNKGGYQIEKV